MTKKIKSFNKTQTCSSNISHPSQSLIIYFSENRENYYGTEKSHMIKI